MKVGPGCQVGPSVVMERFCRGHREGPSGMAEKMCREYCQGLSVVAKKICRGYCEGQDGLSMNHGGLSGMAMTICRGSREGLSQPVWPENAKCKPESPQEHFNDLQSIRNEVLALFYCDHRC